MMLSLPAGTVLGFPARARPMDDESAETPFNEPEAGPTWAERAQLDPLGAVLDPADTRGGKNRLIDHAHKYALGRAAGDVRGARVLDFGCGTGRLSEWFVRSGASVDGVDVTPEMVAVAQTVVPQGRFQTIDASTLPFANGHFDLIVSVAVLQYYVGTDASITRELARVLRKGGQLLAIEQVTDSDLGRGGTPADYDQMLRAAGFRVDEISMIRISDSKILAFAQRLPVLAGLPTLPWLMTLEARRRAGVPLTGYRYADALFRATRAAD
jgi:SAM-dependent methyltransferase